MGMVVGLDSTWQGAATFVLVGLFAGLLILATRVLPRAARPAFSGVSSAMLGPLGALFGLAAAFLAASVWQSHGDAIHAGSQEAQSLSEAWVASGSLPEPLRGDVRRGIAAYVKVVVAEEWPLLPSLTAFDNPVSNRARDELLAPIRRLMAADGSASAAQAMTAHALQTALEARSRRIDVALHRISVVRLFSTAALGLLLITLVAVVHHGSPGAQVIAVVIASIAVAVSVSTIVVHDNPFSGYMAMTADDFAHLAEYGASTDRP